MSRPPNHTSENKPEVAEAIVDAAERLLKAYGYQKMTMTDLAAEAGIGVGTTYLHFSSKADVAVAVAERHQSAMLNELREMSKAPEAPSVLLQNLLWRRVQVPFEFVRTKYAVMSWQQLNRHGMEFMDDIKKSDPGRVEIWKTNEANFFASVVQSGIRTNAFLLSDPECTAKTLVSAIHGFLPKNLDQHDFENPHQFEIKVKNVIRMLVDGISSHRTACEV